jgi:hypothetical protein
LTLEAIWQPVLHWPWGFIIIPPTTEMVLLCTAMKKTSSASIDLSLFFLL